MSFEDTMRIMLPPKSGKVPKDNKVAGYFGAKRVRTVKGQRVEGTHDGVDFNYGGVGQNGINREHPPVYSPVNGYIESVASGQGTYGTVVIREDKTDFIHRVLHLDTVSVRPGAKIKKGQQIGRMGGRGPGGRNQYQQHIHYEVRKPDNEPVNPIAWWDNRDSSQQQKKVAQGTGTVKPEIILQSKETANKKPENSEQINNQSNGNDTLNLLDFLLKKQIRLPTNDISDYLPRLFGIQPQKLLVDEFYVINNQPEFDITVPAGTAQQQIAELRNTAQLMTQDAEASLRALVNGGT